MLTEVLQRAQCAAPPWAKDAVTGEQLLAQHQAEADKRTCTAAAAAARQADAKAAKSTRLAAKRTAPKQSADAADVGKPSAANDLLKGQLQRGARGGAAVRAVAETEAAVAEGALEVGFYAHLKRWEVQQRQLGAFSKAKRGRSSATYTLQAGQSLQGAAA